MNIQHSEQLDKLADDLCKLQSKLPHVNKDSAGYGYNYSSLPDTLDTVKPLLHECGFSVSQFGDGGDGLITMLLHKSGQYIKGTMKLVDIDMKGVNDAQRRGAVISYFRRYAIQAILGMAAEDTDGTVKSKVDPVKKSIVQEVKEKQATSNTENKPSTKATVAFAQKPKQTKPVESSTEIDL